MDSNNNRENNNNDDNIITTTNALSSVFDPQKNTLNNKIRSKITNEKVDGDDNDTNSSSNIPKGSLRDNNNLNEKKKKKIKKKKPKRKKKKNSNNNNNNKINNCIKELFRQMMNLKNQCLLIPLFFWIFLMISYEYLPYESRRPIDVKTLGGIDYILIGTPLIYKLFPENDFLIILAAIPYIAHFSLVFIYSAYLIFYIKVNPLTFLFYFGLVNAIGVLWQIVFPTAPPWYLERHGFGVPANYDTPSDPGNLSRLDELSGIPLIQKLYGKNPIVFGSCPSLHFAWPMLILIYEIKAIKCIPKPVLFLYCIWIAWAAIYTRHHFLIDVIVSLCITVYVTLFAERFLINSKTPMNVKLYHHHHHANTHRQYLLPLRREIRKI